MQNNVFKIDTDANNQLISFLFCRPIDPSFFVVLLVDQKNLVSPNVLFLELLLCAVLVSHEIEAHNLIQPFLLFKNSLIYFLT